MPKTKIQKKELAVKLADKLIRSKSVVFADYQGLTMAQLSDLRQKLAEQQAEFHITKNTVLEHALKQADRDQLPEELKSGPTATLFSYDDEILPIKTLVKSLKEFQFGKVKAGFLGRDTLTSDQIIKLAGLPSKLELQAKVVGILGSPLYGIVGVLQANIRNLVYAVDQIRVKKGGE